ncbi:MULTISPECIES: lipopolysaccharide biosynthesis protein [Bacillus cereus group]|uniref:lipopolysaccharide biosynthesis protein n=1 Tax=Bacillus cereus group TaxID=86661 RepID=UPI000A3D5D91|nr:MULTISPECIES: lipopolysaccharide biosynthesis protein [Bacillus cereus group]MDZ4476648.1 lipopolysaccharide biosynthesis protein [Bacillus cereus]MDZ4496719.1 lipopolysaccharide biosynthesis protein [Bacillus cereus]MDZ4518707.1 lipopolysaccharide biosynthesis protein [Bacillus cereus]OUA60518.1 hypothetical protein BK785_08095 [Bacillus thuringiensis serovar bolivia]OUA77380.1 hypothetical protein BK787_10730 [Bacillus thuringiensis serovar pahangi]
MNSGKFLKVIFVDIFSLVIGLISSFFIPKMFSIEEYSIFRTFGLYISFAGMLHFGFSDGLYVKYGGLRESDINREQFKKYTSFFLVFISVISILIIGSSYFLSQNKIILYFAIYVLPYQIVLFFQMFYRAISEFNRYVVIQSAINVMNLVCILFVLFVGDNKQAENLIMLQLGIYYLVAVYLVIKFFKANRKIENSYSLKFQEIWKICSTGFIIMIANTISILLLSLDRWMIKLNFSYKVFAYYSFAVSILTLVSVLIGSITVILFPYISQKRDDYVLHQRIKDYVLIGASFVVTGFFILKYILDQFLPEYSYALDYTFILFLAIPYMSVINIVYSSLYKVQDKSQKYLRRTIEILIISLGMNVIALIIFKDAIAITVSTLISFIIWFIVSKRDFPFLVIKKGEGIFLLINILIMVLIKFSNISSVLSFILAIVLIVTNSWIFYRKTIMDLISLYSKKNKKYL